MKASTQLIATLLGGLALATALTEAGEIGHYNGGVVKIRDYFVPEPGFYGVGSAGSIDKRLLTIVF